MNFRISRCPELSEPCTGREVSLSEIKFDAEDGSWFVCANNLLTAAKYYWGVCGGDGTYAEIRSFETEADEIRVIDAGSCQNMRDLGGKKTLDGRRIKQGMIFRSAHIEPEHYDYNSLVGKGKRVMRDELGIKTHYDLRWEACGKLDRSAIDPENVAYFLRTPGGYTDLIAEGSGTHYVTLFNMMTDEANYPIIFHCVAGADRTGLLAMVIEGLLGLPDREIRLDYNFTSLCSNRCWDVTTSELWEGVKAKYPECTTIAEFCENYVRDFVGITDEQIEKIRSIMLEDC